MQIFLDCDGVLADFDRAATDLLGMPPREYEKRRGIAAFWQAIARHPDFYGTLPLMPDAMELFDAVQHLSPLILTALPRGSWAAPQKVRCGKVQAGSLFIIGTPWRRSAGWPISASM